MKTYKDAKQPIILAHRGGAGKEYRENSLEAFQNAVKAGCEYLETDVWFGSDGNLYLSHGAPSPNLDRYLSLDALFNAFPDSYFAIDPKHEAAVEPLAKLISSRGLVERVCIGSSFDGRAKRVAAQIEKLIGKIPATALVSAGASADLLLGSKHLAKRRDELEALFIHVHAKLITPRTVKNAHKYGLKLIAWVVNDAETMKRFLDWGVDGFMTDYPALSAIAFRR